MTTQRSDHPNYLERINKLQTEITAINEIAMKVWGVDTGILDALYGVTTIMAHMAGHIDGLQAKVDMLEAIVYRLEGK